MSNFNFIIEKLRTHLSKKTFSPQKQGMKTLTSDLSLPKTTLLDAYSRLPLDLGRFPGFPFCFFSVFTSHSRSYELLLSSELLWRGFGSVFFLRICTLAKFYQSQISDIILGNVLMISGRAARNFCLF